MLHRGSDVSTTVAAVSVPQRGSDVSTTVAAMSVPQRGSDVSTTTRQRVAQLKGQPTRKRPSHTLPRCGTDLDSTVTPTPHHKA